MADGPQGTFLQAGSRAGCCALTVTPTLVWLSWQARPGLHLPVTARRGEAGPRPPPRVPRFRHSSRAPCTTGGPARRLGPVLPPPDDSARADAPLATQTAPRGAGLQAGVSTDRGGEGAAKPWPRGPRPRAPGAAHTVLRELPGPLGHQLLHRPEPLSLALGTGRGQDDSGWSDRPQTPARLSVCPGRRPPGCAFASSGSSSPCGGRGRGWVCPRQEEAHCPRRPADRKQLGQREGRPPLHSCPGARPAAAALAG